MFKPHAFSLIASFLLPLAACAQTQVVDTATSVAAEANAADASPVFADTLWLDNGTVKLGVSPSVGRITWFGFSGGENLIWVNPVTVDTPPDGDPDAWINYGGDKVWHSPQPLWPYFLPHGKNWPPDGAVDGQPWHVLQHDEHRVVIQSPPSDVAGAILTRTVELSPASNAMVLIENRIDRVSPRALPLQAWAVSQAVPPDAVALSAYGHPQRDDGQWVLLADGERFGDELRSQAAWVTWTPQGEATYKKVGTTGGWIAARFGDTAWVQRHYPDLSGNYPENTNVQLYVAEDYVELELLSEMRELPVGRTLVHRTQWTLTGASENEWGRLLGSLAMPFGKRPSFEDDPSRGVPVVPLELPDTE